MTLNTISMFKMFHGIAQPTADSNEKRFCEQEQALEALTKKVSEVQSAKLKQGVQVKENDRLEFVKFISLVEEMEAYSKNARFLWLSINVLWGLHSPKDRADSAKSTKDTLHVLESSADKVDRMIERMRANIDKCRFHFSGEILASLSKPVEPLSLPTGSLPLSLSSSFSSSTSNILPFSWAFSSSSSSSSSSSMSSSISSFIPRQIEHKSRKKKRQLRGREVYLSSVEDEKSRGRRVAQASVQLYPIAPPQPQAPRVPTRLCSGRCICLNRSC